MKKNNLVSVIVPVYNAEKYLNKCIESILNQSYKNLEVICINDGSSDNSLGILEEYKQKDNRLVIIDKENNGVSSARNHGIKISKGELITFVDSDDWLEQDAIDNMVKLIIENDCDVIRTNYYLNYVGKDEFKNNNIQNKLYKKEEINNKLIEKFLLGELNCYTVLLLIKKEILISNNMFFNENVAMLEDKLFYLNLLLNINTIYLSDETYTYHYFQNSDGASLSTKNIERNIDNIIKVNDIVLEILQKCIEQKDDLLIKSNTYHMGLLLYYFYLLYTENKNNKEKIVQKIRQVFSNETIKKMDVNILSKDSKIQFKLIKNKKIKLLFLYYKIKKILKMKILNICLQMQDLVKK